MNVDIVDMTRVRPAAVSYMAMPSGAPSFSAPRRDRCSERAPIEVLFVLVALRGR